MFFRTILSAVGPIGFAWVGLSNFDGEDFRWVDGTIADSGHISWADTEPNENDEHCVRVIAPEYRCYDDFCDLQTFGLCEKEIGT